MPISYVVDQGRGQIHSTASGPITVREILSHFESVQKADLLALAELIDARPATQPYLTPNDVWSAANWVLGVKTRQPFGPRAVVVDNLTKFGLVRIFAQLVSDWIPMSVFRDEATAAQWLANQPQVHRAAPQSPQSPG